MDSERERMEQIWSNKIIGEDVIKKNCAQKNNKRKRVKNDGILSCMSKGKKGCCIQVEWTRID